MEEGVYSLFAFLKIKTLELLTKQSALEQEKKEIMDALCKEREAKWLEWEQEKAARSYPILILVRAEKSPEEIKHYFSVLLLPISVSNTDCCFSCPTYIHKSKS